MDLDAGRARRRRASPRDSVGLATLTYVTIERPMLRLKNRVPA
jgi:hypothetical protein